MGNKPMYWKVLVALVASLTVLPAVAGPSADNLSACLAENTTGKERKELARWIFVAMAMHPDMQGLSTATGKTREQTLRYVGTLITRLVSDNCAKETRNAVRNEGGSSLQSAFGSLGKLAMQELMTNPEVNATLTGFEKYLDEKKIEAVLGQGK